MTGHVSHNYFTEEHSQMVAQILHWMTTTQRSNCILAGIVLIAAFLTPIQVFAQTTHDDPAEWRDGGKKELRTYWDTLEGKPAPSLDTLQGWLNVDNPQSWEDLRGQVVLIDYWATWCGPCKKGIPHLIKMQEQYKDENLTILGVHSARGFEKMPEFVEKEELKYTFADDRERVLGKELGIKYIPAYFVVDKQGIMRIAGANRNKLDDIVKTLTKEPYVDSDDAGWPPYVKKNLYADDFRGQKVPDYAIQKWVTKTPDTKGKIILIDLWATWCGPCKKAIPELNKLQKEFKDDLVIIGLSDEPANVVQDFMKKTKIDYSMAVDTKGKLKKKLNVMGIPHVIIVDTSGIIRWQGLPSDKKDKLTSDLIETIIEKDPGVAKRREEDKKKDEQTHNDDG